MENIEIIKNHLVELKKLFIKDELFPTLVPEASTIIHENPFAFCVATCLDRGTKAELIWTIPYWISQKVGHFDPHKFNKMTLEEITRLFEELPKKPRYINAAPLTFMDITGIVVENFNGDAAAIWTNKSASQVKKTFLSVYGVGNGIANMAVLLIEEAYGLRFADQDRSRMDIKPDVHTMRVLYRLGMAKEVNEIEAIIAARSLNPEYPGILDGPLWYLGRNWCLASAPTCSECPVEDCCEKVDL